MKEWMSQEDLGLCAEGKRAGGLVYKDVLQPTFCGIPPLGAGAGRRQAVLAQSCGGEMTAPAPQSGCSPPASVPSRPDPEGWTRRA